MTQDELEAAHAEAHKAVRDWFRSKHGTAAHTRADDLEIAALLATLGSARKAVLANKGNK